MTAVPLTGVLNSKIPLRNPTNVVFPYLKLGIPLTVLPVPPQGATESNVSGLLLGPTLTNACREFLGCPRNPHRALTKPTVGIFGRASSGFVAVIDGRALLGLRLESANTSRKFPAPEELGVGILGICREILGRADPTQIGRACPKKIPFAKIPSLFRPALSISQLSVPRLQYEV